MDLIDYLTTLSREHDDAIPFEVFMREALYHPEHGYYTANIQAVGGATRGADFSTSATLLPELAKSIAAWVQEELRHHRHKDDDINHLIEIGPGDATLLFNTLRHLHRRVRRTVTIHLVEISPPLEFLQREKLAKFGNIHWHPDIDSALAASQGHALIYSNELVDAFPATALRQNAETNQWEEICLSFSEENGLAETFRPFTPSSNFSALEGDHSPNQRIEVHRSYRDWLSTWLPQLQAGSLLTIDYGGPAENLYHRRPLGTLRAYYKHQCFSGPPEIYARFGKQDLTADVNFTDLAAWAEESGLQTVSIQSQADFTGTGDPAAQAFQVLSQRTPAFPKKSA